MPADQSSFEFCVNNCEGEREIKKKQKKKQKKTKKKQKKTKKKQKKSKKNKKKQKKAEKNKHTKTLGVRQKKNL